MIHIENINITVNAQAISDEAEIPPRTLDIELLKTLINNFITEGDEAEEVEPEKQDEVQPSINAARLNCLLQQSDAWNAICEVLYEVRPHWCEGTDSAKEQAVAAIRAMAKAR